MSKKDLLILVELRRNARETLTKISRRTSIPVSTIFDKIRQYEGGLIRQHTCLLDFHKLGFTTRAHVMVKVERDTRDAARIYLMHHPNVNSVLKITNGFDYLLEVVFLNIKDLEDFMETLDFKFKLQNQQVYHVIEDLKKEAFLADPQLLDLIATPE